MALFQEYTLSPAEECIPCSPRRGDRVNHPASRQGAGQETLPGAAEGLEPPGSRSPVGGEGPRAGVACGASAAPSLCGPRGFACVVLQSPAHLSRGC